MHSRHYIRVDFWSPILTWSPYHSSMHANRGSVRGRVQDDKVRPFSLQAQPLLKLILLTWISYSYFTVRVWYCSYCTSTRQNRVRVLITMISHEYTWYNWLVPCQRNWNPTPFQVPALFCKIRSIYSIRAVSKSQLSNWLFY